MDPALLWQLLPVALTAVVFVGHARGYKLPILTDLLNDLTGKPAAPAPSPVDPAKYPVLSDILATILAELKKRLPHPSDAAPAPTAQLVQKDDGTHQIVVSLPGVVTK